MVLEMIPPEAKVGMGGSTSLMQLGVIEAKPRVTQISIILVSEDLGLGWDPDWDQERQDKISLVFSGEWARLRAARSG